MKLVVILVSVKCCGSPQVKFISHSIQNGCSFVPGWEKEGGLSSCCLQGTWMTVTLAFLIREVCSCSGYQHLMQWKGKVSEDVLYSRPGKKRQRSFLHACH